MTTPQRHAPRGPVKAKSVDTDPIQLADPMHCEKCGQDHAGRCAAHRRSGKPCTNWPIKGAVVCRMHGGSAPQVKDAAQARLDRLVIPAINRIGQLIEQKEFPSVAYQASKDVLDRQRGKAVEHIDAKITAVNDMSDEQLREKALALLGLTSQNV